jgi:hypothetical protein
MVLPMLDEREWDAIRPFLTSRIERAMAYRRQSGAGLAEALSVGAGPVLALFEQLTGFAETNADAIWHHRISLYGAPCSACGRRLRTARARRCAECGAAAASTERSED